MVRRKKSAASVAKVGDSERMIDSLGCVLMLIRLEMQARLAQQAKRETSDNVQGTNEGIRPSVWLPGENDMEEDEELQYDLTAYDCMTSLSLEWPSLSFDVITDSLGDNRKEFPHTLSFVAGTQAANSKGNYLAVVRVTHLSKGKHGQKESPGGDDSDDDMLDSEDDEEEEEDAGLHVRKMAHSGGVNRVRTMPQNGCIVASWSDTAQVNLWDVSSLYQELVQEGEKEVEISKKVHKMNALQVHTHSKEGYALDWSPCVAGRLASGDCRSKIHVWEPSPGGKWSVGGALKGHEDSVEDIQWSPGEATVFASASVDKTIRIWDTRETSRPMITFTAHETDVNVISWNLDTMYMLASGGDDGHMRVWDLRNVQAQTAAGSTATPVANFTHHRGPVTSIEWCPYEASMLTTTSSDDTLAIWDLALERDPEEEAALAPDTNVAAPEDLPPQLLFVHAGQKDMKEAHWHRQIPGMVISTALNGFNIFKPANIL